MTAEMTGGSTRGRLATYLIALAIVALIAVAQVVALWRAIDDQRQVGTIVNLAGRERFLSQRIAISADELVRVATAGARTERRSELVADADDFAKRFAELAAGTTPGSPDGWPPAGVRAIFERPPYSLAIQVRDYVARAHRLAATRNRAIVVDNPDLNYLLEFNAPLYRAFDRAVAAYAADAQARAMHSEGLAGIAFAALLAALLGVYRFLLVPLESRVVAHEAALQRRNTALENVEAGARRMAESLDPGAVSARLTTALAASLGVPIRYVEADEPDNAVVARARLTNVLTFEATCLALPLSFLPLEDAFAFLVADAAADRPFDEADRLAAQSLLSLWERSVRNARLYEELEASQRRISELDQLKSDLIAMLAHDFKGPLTSMIGYAQLLRDGVLEGDEVVVAANFMVDASWRLSQLASDTLTMSLLERNDLEVLPTAMDLMPMLHSIANSYASERAVSIVSPVDVVQVEGDPARLSQVFQNLVSNAVKYSPSGAAVDVNVTFGEGSVAVAVRDHGIGIPAAERERIFERFARASNAKASAIPGTGFGLYLAKTLVELHNGTIALESVENEGSTFTVRLPQSAPVDERASHAWNGMTVSTIA